MKENQLVQASHLITTFPYDKNKRLKAVNDVSIEINKGEIIGLVGESGSGKSVTAMSIQQLILPPGKIEGDIRIDAIDGNLLTYGVYSEQARKVRGGKIGMIFQEPMTSLNPILTVGEQIQENVMLHLGLGKEEARKRSIEMMKAVGIANPEIRFNEYPMQFSGGMRQRIMIAMVMAAEPEVVIADEATTALDVTTQAQVLELICSYSRSKNVSVVIITHNLGLIARYADRIYVMYSGHIVEQGEKFELFRRPVHPYTRGLLAAVPRLDDPKERRLIPIEGMPPNPSSMPEYCKFYDRCKYRIEGLCNKSDAELCEISEGHLVRCHLSLEELDKKQNQLGSTNDRVVKKNISNETVLVINALKMYFPIYKGIAKKLSGEVKAVDGVSFSVRRGETLGIVGESGCGKSTLAKCIMRAYTPTEGSIEFKGRDIARLKERQLKEFRTKIAMIFQDPYSSLNPRQKAEDIIGEPLLINKLTTTREEYDQRINELFTMVGLNPDYRDRFPREFSGGQRQRIGIARALASNPDIIVCDEPVSALDVSIQAQIINLLEDIQARLGVTYIFIAHDLSVVKHISDRIIVMYLGSIVEIADAGKLYENPLHPYTKTLLSAVPISDPETDASRERIKLIGEIPSVMERPKGCPFSTRCPYVSNRCHSERPELKQAAEGQQVACFLYD